MNYNYCIQNCLVKLVPDSVYLTSASGSVIFPVDRKFTNLPRYETFFVNGDPNIQAKIPNANVQTAANFGQFKSRFGTTKVLQENQSSSLERLERVNTVLPTSTVNKTFTKNFYKIYLGKLGWVVENQVNNIT